MTDLQLMAEVIAERIGETLLEQHDFFYIQNDLFNKMPGIHISCNGISVFDPREFVPPPELPSGVWQSKFSWEELDEAIECFVKIKRAL